MWSAEEQEPEQEEEEEEEEVVEEEACHPSVPGPLLNKHNAGEQRASLCAAAAFNGALAYGKQPDGAPPRGRRVVAVVKQLESIAITSL
ncbi:unnamed protein product [Arctogadus glacialis]